MSYAIKDFIGGFPPELFDHPVIRDHIHSGNAANGGGYIGRWQERNTWRDQCTYENLRKLDLGDDFIVMFLTSKIGRWYAESFTADYGPEYGKTKDFTRLLGVCVEEKILQCQYVPTKITTV